jgi:hypothetical protein
MLLNKINFEFVMTEVAILFSDPISKEKCHKDFPKDAV